MNDLLKHIGLRIQEAVEEKNWASVEHWSKELLKYAPQKALGFKWLARASMALGKIDRAAYAYNRVLDFESDNEEARKFFADYQSNSMSEVSTTPAKDLSENDIFHVLSPDQKSLLARAEFEAATAYESAKLYAEAAERFKKSFYWSPHPQAAYKAASMFHRCQRSPEALKLLRDTLSANPRWIEGHLLAGEIYFDLGQLTSAQNEWQTVLKLEPRNEEALKRLRSTWDMRVNPSELGPEF